MKLLSNFSVKRPVTILMSVLIVIILGVISFVNLTTDLFPSINLPYAVVSTTYVGASPEEVEKVVTKPIESSMATLTNIKNVSSTSRENVSMIMLEFNEEANMDSAMIEIRENLDMIIPYMPDSVGSPTIIKLNPDMMPIMQASIAIKDKTISESTKIVKDEIVPILESAEGVASIELYGTSEDEIRVTLNDSKMAQYQNMGIKFNPDMIKGILSGQNFEMPVGYINDNDTEYLVRVGDDFKSIDEIKSLPIISNEHISITLNDIADIEMNNTNTEQYTKVNSENAIIVIAQKQNNYATTDVSKNLTEKIELVKEKYKDAEVLIIMDQAEYINQAVGSVGNNLIYGGILAMLILFIFLRDIKPTIVISLAIPISIMAAFVLIYFSGITLNIVSLGGLALGIGMLVDNSIVVIENIYRLRNSGVGRKEAAMKGAMGVAGAITASTLTTIAVFIPIVFLKGWTAEIFMEMALTITFSLTASLLIALTLVPMISSKILNKDDVSKEYKTLDKIKRFYKKTINLGLKHKFITISVIIILFVGSIIGSLNIGTEFFPTSDTGQLTITLNMPKGSDYETTKKEMDEVTNIIDKLDSVDLVAGLISNDNMMMAMNSGSGTIYVLLKDDIKKTTTEVADEIRDLTKNRESEVLVSSGNSGMSMMMESGISVEIKGNDLDTLESLANEVATIISEVEGTTEIDNGIDEASPEIKVTVDRASSIANGLTTANVYMTLSKLINIDNKATTISIDGYEYDVNVYSGNEKDIALDDLKNSKVSGVKLDDISDISTDTGFGAINRTNQTRMVTVTANIESDQNIGIIGDKIEEKLDELDVPAGYQVTMAGEQAEINSSMNSLFYALLLAVVLIYMVMAAQFESLLYPFIVMFTIPLAFTGSFLALWITNTPLSIVAFIGIIILTGVVVNNGIVLVDYINQLKDEGMSSREAVIEAGMTRIRPIIMTALTTILAMSTMAIGVGEGAEMIAPMAISTIGGLIFATILTLVIVPVIYAGIDRLKERRHAK